MSSADPRGDPLLEAMLVKLEQQQQQNTSQKSGLNTTSNTNPNTTTTTADNILLSMLDGEVHRLRTVERTQSEGIERSSRDQKRLAVMLGVSHDQIQLLTERNDKYADEIKTLTDRNRELQELLSIEQQKVRLAAEDRQAVEIMAKANSAKTVESLERIKLEKHLVDETVERLRKELGQVKERLEEQKHLAEIESRKAFELRVALETRLKTVEEERSFLEDMRAKESRAATHKAYDQSTEVRALKNEASDLRASLEAVQRNATEQVQAFRQENTILLERAARAEKEAAEIRHGALERLLAAEQLAEARLEENDQLRKSSKMREKALETQAAKLVSDLMSAQAEVNDLAAREHSAHDEQVQKIVRLSAELHAAGLREEETQRVIESLKGSVAQKDIEAAVARTNASNALQQRERELSEKLTAKGAQLSETSEGLRLLQLRLNGVEAQLTQVTAERDDERAAHHTTVTALRAEVDGYRTAVRKLEQHIRDGVEHRLLTEHNETLLQTVDHLKTQLVAANSALATARTESDIEDNHRLLLLQDSVEAQLARVHALELERQAARPLLTMFARHLHHQGSVEGSGGGGGMIVASSAQERAAAAATGQSPSSTPAALRTPSNVSPAHLVLTPPAITPKTTHLPPITSAMSSGPAAQQQQQRAAIARALDAFTSRFGGLDV